MKISVHVPLVALLSLGLMHLGITRLLGVLGRRRRVDEHLQAFRSRLIRISANWSSWRSAVSRVSEIRDPRRATGRMEFVCFISTYCGEELEFTFWMTGFGSKTWSLVCRLQSLRIPPKASRPPARGQTPCRSGLGAGKFRTFALSPSLVRHQLGGSARQAKPEFLSLRSCCTAHCEVIEP